MYMLLEREALKIGLVVNEEKTKYMRMSRSEDRRRPQDIEIGNKRFEGVIGFKYLEVMLYSDNSISKEIRERIQAGNRAYYANKKLFTNQVITRRTKITIYNTLVRPVVIYGAETWTLKDTDVKILRVFERRILRKIFGPVRTYEGWRERYNAELDELVEGKDGVRLVKARRIDWMGHVERLKTERMP